MRGGVTLGEVKRAVNIRFRPKAAHAVIDVLSIRRACEYFDLLQRSERSSADKGGKQRYCSAC